ncbi:atp-dependent RNA helicase, partial [Thalassiosira pseudonana CCMP1335]
WIYPVDEKYPERSYQLQMSQTAIMANTLVSLPTGLGKTLIAAVVMYNYYRWFPTGKVVFCAPTRPLVTQQIQACYKIMGIPELHTAEISGRSKPESRENMWNSKRVFFCTPHTLVKDIEGGRCDAKSIVCVVMDEAHRATGNHANALLVNMIEEAGAKFRLVGLSATPGTDIKSIQVILDTLKINQIEAKTEDDPDVKRYIHHREEEVIIVKQPDVVKSLDKKF